MPAKHHFWRIKRQYFDQLISGKKTLEIRVGYRSVQRIQAGDTITFENYGPNRFLVTRVSIYPNFQKAFAAEDLRKALPYLSPAAARRAYRKIYPPQREKLGIYVLELECLEPRHF